MTQKTEVFWISETVSFETVGTVTTVSHHVIFGILHFLTAVLFFCVMAPLAVLYTLLPARLKVWSTLVAGLHKNLPTSTNRSFFITIIVDYFYIHHFLNRWRPVFRVMLYTKYNGAVDSKKFLHNCSVTAPE